MARLRKILIDRKRTIRRKNIPQVEINKWLTEAIVAGFMRFDLLGDFISDAAAATGGVPLGGLYRTGSVLKVRLT